MAMRQKLFTRVARATLTKTVARVAPLVVVALGHVAELAGEALAASIVLACGTAAVTPPAGEGLHDPVQLGVVGEHHAALARRDVVGGVER